jgi:hypothetical protein
VPHQQYGPDTDPTTTADNTAEPSPVDDREEQYQYHNQYAFQNQPQRKPAPPSKPSGAGAGAASYRGRQRNYKASRVYEQQRMPHPPHQHHQHQQQHAHKQPKQQHRRKPPEHYYHDEEVMEEVAEEEIEYDHDEMTAIDVFESEYVESEPVFEIVQGEVEFYDEDEDGAIVSARVNTMLPVDASGDGSLLLERDESTFSYTNYDPLSYSSTKELFDADQFESDAGDTDVHGNSGQQNTVAAESLDKAKIPSNLMLSVCRLIPGSFSS